jgi:hypothetical protein
VPGRWWQQATGSGRLLVTSRRLAFRDYKHGPLALAATLMRDPFRREIDLQYTDVASVEFQPWWRNLRALPMSAVVVRTVSGDEFRFSFYFTRGWANEIRELALHKQ